MNPPHEITTNETIVIIAILAFFFGVMYLFYKLLTED